MTRFAAAALRSAATSVLAVSTSSSCTVSSAREASSRSRTTDSLSMTFCTEFSWPVSSAGSCDVSTIDRPISDGSPVW